MNDGEMKYLGQTPCGKCVDKFLEHVQDNEVKVRC